MADGAGDGSSNIFDRTTIFFGARTPDRNKYIEKARVNGANVVPLEARARILIADCERRHLNPPGSISYTWIDDSIAAGEMLDIKDYSAAPLLVPAHRPVGALKPAKQSRAPFTHADDVELYNWVQAAKRRGESIKGNEIYKQLEKKNKRHPYQSWRDRYIKYLADRPPAGAKVSDAVPSSSPAPSGTTSAVPEVQNAPENVIPEATWRNPPGLWNTGTLRPVIVLPSLPIPTALASASKEPAENETLGHEEPLIDAPAVEDGGWGTVGDAQLSIDDEAAIFEALPSQDASVNATSHQAEASNDHESQATASPEPGQLTEWTQEEENKRSGKPRDGRPSRPFGWSKGDGADRESQSSDVNNDFQNDNANDDEVRQDQDIILPDLDSSALPETLPSTPPSLLAQATTQSRLANDTFTEAEHDDLLAQAEDIEDVAVGKWRVCWKVYAKQHPEHTADEWMTYYETMIRPQYRSTRPETTTQEHEDELAAQLIESSLTSTTPPFGSASSPFKASTSVANTKRKRVTSPLLSQEDAVRDGSPSRGSNTKRLRSESVVPDVEDETAQPQVPDNLLEVGDSQRLRYDSQESWNGFSPGRDVGPDFGIYDDQDDSLEDEQENAILRSQDSQHHEHDDVPGKLQVFGDQPQDFVLEKASQDESQEFYDASQGDQFPIMKLVPKVAPIPTPELLKRKSRTLDQVVNSSQPDDDVDSEHGTEEMFSQGTEKVDQDWNVINDVTEMRLDDQARINAQVARETAHLHKGSPSSVRVLRKEIAESEQGDDEVETKWPEEEIEEDEEVTDEELVQEVFVDEESVEDSEDDNDFRPRARAHPVFAAPSFDSDMILPPDDSVAGDDEPPTSTPRKPAVSQAGTKSSPAGSVSDLEDYTIMTLPVNSDNGDIPDADNAIPSTEHGYVDTQALLQAETQALDADLPLLLSQDLSQWPPNQVRLTEGIVPSSPAIGSMRSPRAAKAKAARQLRDSSSLFIHDDDERDTNYQSSLPPLGDNDEQDDIVVTHSDAAAIVVNDDDDDLETIDPDDPGLLIEAWRDEQMAAAKGDPLNFVDYSLQRTSPALDLDLAAVVLASLKAGKGVPRRVKGIWTEEDDKLMLETDQRVFGRMTMITARNKLRRLHGEHAYQARLQELKEYE